MLKRMKIGGKLTLAFGRLLLSSPEWALMSWMNMSEVQREANSLAQHTSEMVIAAGCQKSDPDMMYEIRGYGYTYQKDFLDREQSRGRGRTSGEGGFRSCREVPQPQGT